jgi:NitT/TauT family transport system permease protein
VTRSRLLAVLLGATPFAVIGLAWELAVALGWLNPFFTSRPSAIAAGLAAQIATGELVTNLGVSLGEFVVGFGLAAIIGVGLGVLAGWYRTLEYAVDPFLWFLYSAPLIAFYPVFVIWFGLGPRTVVAIAFLLAAPPIMANTMSGVKRTDRDLVRAARAFGARDRDIFLNVALPGSVPVMVAGLRLGVGRALTGVVIAELFGSTAGLGFSLGYYGQVLRTTDMMVALLVIVALGVAVTQMLSLIEARVDSWRTGPGH